MLHNIQCLYLITVLCAWWHFLLIRSTCNFVHCSCIGYLVILHENYKLLWAKSRIELNIIVQNWNRSVQWDGDMEDGVICFFQGRDASCSTHPPVALCLNPRQMTAVSICSDIFTLHMCKLCSNSSDEFQFQAFPHFLPKLHPKVNLLFKVRPACLQHARQGWARLN